ncbi:hypothetical protein SAY87_003182 [Trapa incisa]|uniref:Formin-like protein n=1 Tax=Trapa incisa TaxID=236973 RepID=A0AAN7KIW8_9MYRT|nr:hypothetical protein SAY87_003182 [Trapa incisa]
MFQIQLCLSRLGCFILLISLALCSWATRLVEASTHDLLDLASVEIDQDTAALLWINCRTELIHVKDAIEDLDLCFPHKVLDVMGDRVDHECLSLPEGNVREIMNAVHHDLKVSILDCLRRNNYPFHVSGEETHSNHWHTKYIESVPPTANNHRRDLASSSSSEMTGEHSTEKKINSLAKLSSKKKKMEGNDTNRQIIIAVVVTASVTIIFAVLLFLCCSKLCSSRTDMGLHDDRPLLSLSMTDYSTGSSHKHYNFGNSFELEKPNSIPRKSSAGTAIDSEDGAIFVQDNLELLHANGSGRHASPFLPLKPPPGRVPSNTGFLKPPPGRAPPPEPPAPANLLAETSPPPLPQSPPIVPKPVTPSAVPTPPGTPPPPPPAGGASKPGAVPPPPMKGPPAPRAPPPPGGPKIGHPPPHIQKAPNGKDDSEEASKTKLKPFFWDKVLASPDHSMVWHDIKSGSFQFNEEMIETLFGYANADKGKKENTKNSTKDSPTPFVQLIDTKKAQNLSILLRALNVTTEEVCDALREGNELPIEFLQTLLKMTPTTDEELKLRLFHGDLSQLGPADRFLKTLVDIPFAFKRMEALLFMGILQEEVTSTKESFEILEVACKELRNSRLFLKLLEAVLKTGNRMNDGTFRGGAQAFKLDTLLKLSDVKGADGKTTLLHFVVQEIIRSEGIRTVRVARESKSFSSVKSDDFLDDVPNDSEEYYRGLGLQAVSGLGGQLENVRKAAAIDSDTLTGSVAKLGYSLLKTQTFLNTDMKDLEEESKFHQRLKSFVEGAKTEIKCLLEEDKRISDLVKSTGDYFHGNAGKDEGLRLFVIVRDFVLMLDKVCKEVRDLPWRHAKPQKKESEPVLTPSVSDTRQPASPDIRRRLFPAIQERHISDSSSDDE